MFRRLVLFAAMMVASAVPSPAQLAETEVTYLGPYYCWGMSYVGGRGNDALYAIYQKLATPGSYPIYIYYAKYDPNVGWVEMDQSLFQRMPDGMHPFFGYWGDQYHVGWVGHNAENGDKIQMIDSPSWDSFASMDAVTQDYDLVPSLTFGNPVPSAYAFSNDRAWVLYCGRAQGSYMIEYYEWNSESGWGPRRHLSATASSALLGVPTVLQLDQSSWRVYYIHEFGGGNPTIQFVETRDGGQTWETPTPCPGVETHHYYSHLSIARYGDNFYLFLIDPDSKCVVYRSADGVAWTDKQILLDDSAVGYYMHHGWLVDQTRLISTVSDRDYWDNWGSGTGDQYGIVLTIPELSASPERPSDPTPPDGGVLEASFDVPVISVLVTGPQTYDVAFYLADGTLLGEARVLKGGDTAVIDVPRLIVGQDYWWYAIARGTTGCYWGGPPATTSDEARSATWRFTYQPATVRPSGFSVPFGAPQRGGLEDLHESDDAYLIIQQRAAPAPLLPVIRLEVEGTTEPLDEPYTWDNGLVYDNGASHQRGPGLRRSVLDDFEVTASSLTVDTFQMKFAWDQGWNHGVGIELTFYGDAGGQPDFENVLATATNVQYTETPDLEYPDFFGLDVVDVSASFEPIRLEAGVVWVDMHMLAPVIGYQVVKEGMRGGSLWVDYEDINGRQSGYDLWGEHLEASFVLSGQEDERQVSSLSAVVETATTARPEQPLQQLYLYDYHRGRWELVDQRTATPTDSVVEVTLDTDAGRFIESASGRLQMRLEWYDPGNAFSPGWDARIDQAVWTVTP